MRPLCYIKSSDLMQIGRVGWGESPSPAPAA